MSARDDRQLAALCRVILGPDLAERVGWTDRPSRNAVDLYHWDGGPLSSGERVLLLTAFAVWNNANKKARVADLFALDAVNLMRVGDALCALACGPDSIDVTIKDYLR